jgi:hygromycin-B 7''-O-kinase
MTKTGVPPAPLFASDDEYERSLPDASFWEPYARAALAISGIAEPGEIVTRTPTTHVAALVGGRVLVKLHFEPRFGEQCFQTERAFYGATRGSGLPVPDLLAEGALYPDGPGWRWPFLVLSAMPGRDLRALRAELSPADLDRAARFVGRSLRALHGTAVDQIGRLARQLYVDLIRDRMARTARDHEAWGSLPGPLVAQVRDYVWDALPLIDPIAAPPRLIHGDLHGGNVFLEPSDDGYRPVGIIDFNDVYVGDAHYDLVSVHLKAFGCDKHLLRVVLDAYGWEPLAADWTRRMMALTLAHDYDMIEPVVSAFPGVLDDTGSLDEAASLLWDLDAPGPGR